MTNLAVSVNVLSRLQKELQSLKEFFAAHLLELGLGGVDTLPFLLP